MPAGSAGSCGKFWAGFFPRPSLQRFILLTESLAREIIFFTSWAVGCKNYTKKTGRNFFSLQRTPPKVGREDSLDKNFNLVAYFVWQAKYFHVKAHLSWNDVSQTYSLVVTNLDVRRSLNISPLCRFWQLWGLDS